MQSFNLIEKFGEMGWLDRSIVLMLVVMSIYSLWVMIDRLIVFGKARRQTDAFIAGLKGHLLKRDLTAALALARAESASPVAKVVAAALTEHQEGLDAMKELGPEELGDFDLVDAINRAIERVKEREVAGLKRGLGGLASISSAAPFIGLLGTVIGIINAFSSMGSSGQGGLGAVSKGISEALFTTATGLFVAIPAVMMFNYFTNSIEAFVVDMNDVSSELLSYVLREGRKK